METNPLGEAWKEEGLGAYSTEAILEALRRYGLEVDEEELLRVDSLQQAQALGARWQQGWPASGPLEELPQAAAVELWRRLGSAQALELPEALLAELDAEAGEPGLEPLYYERFASASPQEQWVLAQQAVHEPGFRGADAFRLGTVLWERMQSPEEQQAFAALLDEWEATAPSLREEEPMMLLWRVALVMDTPGSELTEPLLRLAGQYPGQVHPLLSLLEWSLYEGRLAVAEQACRSVWPQLKATAGHSEAWSELRLRALLVVRDLEWQRQPVPSREQLRERLERWVAEPLTEDEVWPGLLLHRRAERWHAAGEVVARADERAFTELLRDLLGAFEQYLREQHGWPWGRTQLIYPWFTRLLSSASSEHAFEARRKRRAAPRLLPAEHALLAWSNNPGLEGSLLHPHLYLATARALEPWGLFLHRLALLNDEELHAWRSRLPAVAVGLTERLGW
jgi:hypothetical protein